jgi:hypothetical protein
MPPGRLSPSVGKGAISPNLTETQKTSVRFPGPMPLSIAEANSGFWEPWSGMGAIGAQSNLILLAGCCLLEGYGCRNSLKGTVDVRPF